MPIRPSTPLRRLRESSGLSQAEVSARLKVDRAHLSRIELGERGLAGHTSILAKLYGVTDAEVVRAWEQSDHNHPGA